MKHFWFSIICILSTLSLFAQEDEVSQEENIKVQKAYGPTIGFGLGTVAMYGDLNDRNYGSPFSSNPGFNVYVIQPVYDFLSVKFNFFTSLVRDEERSLSRNVNYETDLRAIAILGEYNFDNFLPKNRKVTPYITAGIEVVEFNPKSDLKAFGGEPYNYWSDGTIRNVSENAANADQSIIIQRDYNYETDIREAGYNNSTTYAERTLAIPVGAGVNLHLNDQFNFRFESVLHLTFSDYIDGLSTTTKKQFIGSKKANANNDHFWYNGISLSYNFQKVQPADNFNIENDEKFDFLASGNTEDYDSDGIIDLIDLCPNTPPNVEVDTNGCPIDTDGDGIADYLDEEVNSEYPEFANDKGVEMTDEMIYLSYLRYIDSTSEFAEVIERDFSGNQKQYKKYRVKVGEFNRGEAPPNINELLSLPDLKKVDQGDKSIYTVGNYKNLEEANQRIESLNKGGFTAEVIKRDASGRVSSINEEESEILALAASKTSLDTSTMVSKPNKDKQSVAFRIQLGAFKAKPTGEKYKNIPSLFIIESDGIFKYMSGSFDTFEEAAKHKVRMIVAGFEGAFIVAYKDGQRVKLSSVGVTPIESNPLIGQ